MQGLGVFATVSGASSRPPIAWGSEKIISVVCRSNYIFVLNSSSIIIFECVYHTTADFFQISFHTVLTSPFRCYEGIREVQRMTLDHGTFLYNLDGQIVFSHSNQFCLLQQIHWFERVC